jgi:hypothetical protein
VAPVYSVRTTSPGYSLYGTSSYNQPASVLNGRVFQLGGMLKF